MSNHIYIPRPVNPIFYPVYGLLYNWYAATDARKISSSDDWVVPSQNQFKTLADYLGAGGNYGQNSVGGKLKETGTTYWQTPNTGATNEVGFNAKGGGERVLIFQAFNQASEFISTTFGYYNPAPCYYSAALAYSNNWFYLTNAREAYRGMPVRLLYVGSGAPTSYTGNDGKNYRIATVGTQTWLADSLCETKFRDNTIIPWFGANPNYFTDAEWAALTTAGCCAYGNTLSNVGPGFSFPS